jgi:uncharacterized phosphosugar-binding protein
MSANDSDTALAGELYLTRVIELLTKIRDTQRPQIEQAAAVIADAVRTGGVVHVFGPGHSHVIAEEAFNRTGGLACINPIVDRTGGRAELVEGYARAILDGHDVRPGEAMIISSNTGINPLPVEMALVAREAGLKVIAITSLEFSKGVAARHSSGKRLYELADVVLDNSCPVGDALVEISGLATPVGASSTIASAAILNAALATAIERLVIAGFDPPVLLSEKRPGEYERNNTLKQRYASRVRAQFTAMLFY